MIKLTRNSTWLIYFTWHFNCHFSCAMCNQFTFYLVSATRYHSRTFHSNMSQMHSGSILAASHFPHLSLVACNWRWRCGGWLCVTMPCPRSRSPLAPCPATDWAPWSPNQSAVPTLRLRPEHGELPRAPPRAAPPHEPPAAADSRTGKLAECWADNMSFLPTEGWFVDFTRVDIWWIEFFIEYVKKSDWTLALLN